MTTNGTENGIIFDDRTTVTKKTIWERKLLDLSLRNNLLNVRMTKGTIPIVSLNVEQLEDALAESKDFQVLPRPEGLEKEEYADLESFSKALPEDSPVHEAVEKDLSQNRLRTWFDEEGLKKALTTLYRSSRLAMEENGANTLYLAAGLLKWYEVQGGEKPRYAPLLLVPVEIIRKSAATGYIIRGRDEETMFNITLLELLRQAFGITISGLDPLPRDESGVDVAAVIKTVSGFIEGQKGWEVVHQALLGNFSFNKFIMWNDIRNNSDVLCRNKTVASLMSGVVDSSVNQEIAEAENLDNIFKAGDIELPISADSSQLEAVDAALSGRSFILHGPPGTGKSQTITNIIANALYRGKRVLFVAEKKAALEVVRNRLESIGLGPFCLELHSNKAKKSMVLDQLKRATEITKKRSKAEYAAEAAHINSVRSEMNNHIEALHRTYPLGVSFYDCMARFLSIDESCPALMLDVSRMTSLSADIVPKMEVALTEYKTACSVIGDPSAAPLAGIALTEYSKDIEDAFDRLQKLLNDSRTLSLYEDKVQDVLFGFRNPVLPLVKVKALRDLVKVVISSEGIDFSAVPEGACENELKIVEEACRHGKERDEIREIICRDYDSRILKDDADALDTEWRMACTKLPVFRQVAQGKVLKRLQTYSNTLTKPKKHEVLPLLKRLATFQEETDYLNRIPLLGQIQDKRWSAVEKACARTREIFAATGRLADDSESLQKMRTSLLSKLRSDGEGLRNNCEITGYDALLCAVEAEVDFIESSLMAEMVDRIDVDWTDAVIQRCGLWIQGRDKLRSWVMYNRKKVELDSYEFSGLSDAVKNIPENQVLDAFHKGLYRTYAEHILAHEPELDMFNGEMFESKIKRFRGLCKDFETLTREEIFAKLASNLPDLQAEASKSTEVGILLRNIKNGCRGTALRKFFDMIPETLPKLCPCMLMSPISVAQYIEAGKTEFDLVIFDEASQMPTCEAVGAIARGKNIIVVGDPKQMPPTSFFSAEAFDEENPEIEDLESILDDTLALSFPSKYLRWHYRSKHESLIAFSNCMYYDSKLLTFPSPDDLTSKIEYQHVEGVYDRGGSRQNKEEAKAVIEEIRTRLQDPEKAVRSIGVVTFNSNQQSLIEDLLTEMFAKEPELEKTAMSCQEPIFVKNLENVQGDERDVILFSVGYGQDKDGRVALNFGPLNRDGGWRRLNVAVSRARYEMKVFSTLRSEQIDLGKTSAEGVAGLKAFLEYAEKGKLVAKSGSSADGVVKDSMVEAVARALRARGHEVRTNIGCSGYRIDLGVVNPENRSEYLLGIICDGYNYHSSKSCRDREIVQIGVLRKLGWKLRRVWAMDWWNDEEAVVSSLCEAIDASAKGTFKEEEEAPLRLYNAS